MKNINTEQFGIEVLEQKGAVMVDFWADWCGPCKMLAPILEEISNERTDIKICKVNVDNEQELAFRYGIRSIPTLLFFKDGQLIETLVGGMDKKSLNKEIDRILKK